jgi:hypothetical protein
MPKTNYLQTVHGVMEKEKKSFQGSIRIIYECRGTAASGGASTKANTEQYCTSFVC